VKFYIYSDIQDLQKNLESCEWCESGEHLQLEEHGLPHFSASYRVVCACGACSSFGDDAENVATTWNEKMKKMAGDA
jgi:hypothetical protein